MLKEYQQTKILDEYVKIAEKHNLGIAGLNFIIKVYEIDPFQSTTIIPVLKNVWDEFNKIVIPEPIKILERRIGEKNYSNRKKFKFKDDTIKIYENHTQKEVEKLERLKKSYEFHILLLIEMLSITDFYSLKLSDQIENKEITRQKRDTSPKKSQFFSLYTKNSLKYKMTIDKTIAKLTSISPVTASRYLNNVDVLLELKQILQENYNSLNNQRNDLNSDNRVNQRAIQDNSEQIENVESNLIYIQDKIDKIKRKKFLEDYNKSRAVEKKSPY